MTTSPKGTALVTGASSGIGAIYADRLAGRGYDLILVARNETRLRQLADELRAGNHIETRVIVRDLSAPDAAKLLFDQVKDIPDSVLVNNAGLGFYGAFAQSKFEEQTQMMQVNMIALVQLTHLFLPAMLARKRGRILNVASTAAFQPGIVHENGNRNVFDLIENDFGRIWFG